MVKRNRHRPLIRVTADGRDIVSHAGSRLLGDLADVLGLTEGLSQAMAPTKHRRREHDRGEVLVDLAVMVAGGGEAISDLAVLRNQPRLFGEVASGPTAWRSLQAIDEDAFAAIGGPAAAGEGHSLGTRCRPGPLCDRHRRHLGHLAFGQARCRPQLLLLTELRGHRKLVRA